MKIDLFQIISFLPFIAEGIFVTLKYTLISIFFGSIWGVSYSALSISLRHAGQSQPVAGIRRC